MEELKWGEIEDCLDGLLDLPTITRFRTAFQEVAHKQHARDAAALSRSLASVEKIEAELSEHWVEVTGGHYGRLRGHSVKALANAVYTFGIQRPQLEREDLARILDVALDKAIPWIPPRYRPDTKILADAIMEAADNG